MGNNAKYLSTQLAKIRARIKVKSEFVDFVKERTKYYESRYTELNKKEKAGTLTDEEFKEWLNLPYILEEYIEFTITSVKEIQRLMTEQDRFIVKSEKFLKAHSAEFSLKNE